MHIFYPSRFYIIDIVERATRICIMMMGLSLLCTGTLLIVFWPSASQTYPQITYSSPVIDMSLIGEGALSRIGSHTLPLDITKELFFLATNDRPGRKIEDLLCVCVLQSSRERYLAQAGERIYLTCDPLADPTTPTYHMSRQITPLWIRFCSADSKRALFELGHVVTSSLTEGFQEEIIPFVVDRTETKDAPFIENTLYVQAFRHAKILGKDQLISHLSQPTYHFLSNTWKVQIPDSDSKTLLYSLAPQDLLQWTGSQWTPIAVQDVTYCKKPLARIQSISDNACTVEIWDEEGFSRTTYTFDAIQPKPHNKMDYLPYSVQMKASKQFLCQFDKRRYLIKEGDIMVRSHRGWKVLKTDHQLDDVIYHRTQGELLLFTSLSHEGGKASVKGIWLDSTRTQSQPFYLPVITSSTGFMEKKTSDKHHKQSVARQKNELSFIYFPPEHPPEHKEISQ